MLNEMIRIDDILCDGDYIKEKIDSNNLNERRIRGRMSGGLKLIIRKP